MRLNFLITKVEKGKTSDWIIFTMCSDQINTFREYKVEFCGTDLDTSMSLTDEVKKLLVEKLVSDFGYSPYDISTVKRTLGKTKNYIIESTNKEVI